MKLGGTLEIGWFPTVSRKTAYAWDERTELPRHPTYLNPPKYMVRDSDGELVESWVQQRRAEWEFCSEDKDGLNFAVRTYYECDDLHLPVLTPTNKPTTVLKYAANLYHLYVDSDILVGSNPYFRTLENVIFKRRDELTRGNARANYEDVALGKMDWCYYYQADRLTVWAERFQRREEALKLIGGPTDWNVTLVVGAMPLDEAGTLPTNKEQLDEVIQLIFAFPAKIYDWRRTY